MQPTAGSAYCPLYIYENTTASASEERVNPVYRKHNRGRPEMAKIMDEGSSIANEVTFLTDNVVLFID